MEPRRIRPFLLATECQQFLESTIITQLNDTLASKNTCVLIFKIPTANLVLAYVMRKEKQLGGQGNTKVTQIVTDTGRICSLNLIKESRFLATTLSASSIQI